MDETGYQLSSSSDNDPSNSFEESKSDELIENIASAAGIPEQEIRENKESIVEVVNFIMDGMNNMPSQTSVIFT